MEKSGENQKLVLIDGHSVLFRAFYAYPMLTTSSGEMVNAVFGFANILLTVIRDLDPTHIAVSFDREKPTFRHKEYEGYKAQRPETPQELVDQQSRVEEVVKVLNIPTFAVEGFEADDVIGTLARQAVRGSESKDEKSRARSKELRSTEVVIVTGDQDMLQLIDEGKIFVYTPARKNDLPKIWDREVVEEKYGFSPQRIVDYKALAGDASDAIPGVKGIGPKTATRLIQAYKTLDGIFENLDELRKSFGESVYTKLGDSKDLAYLSYKLATINTQAPIKLVLNDCLIHDYDKEKAVELFSDLEFRSLIPKLPNDSFEQMVQDALL